MNRHSIVIQWSDEDQKYVVSLPEFDSHAHTPGKTYKEALQNAQEVLELFIEDYQARDIPLPSPIFLDHPKRLLATQQP